MLPFMKTVALILALLLGLQTWGVVGAAQVMGIRYSCTAEVGPLCYLWEESVLGKLLPEGDTSRIEEALADAREVFDEQFVKRLVRNKDGKLNFDRFFDRANKTLDKARDAAQDILEAATED